MSNAATRPLPAGPDDRRAAILEMVMAAGSIKIEDLPEAFGVSLMTVHRDLDTSPHRA